MFEVPVASRASTAAEATIDVTGVSTPVKEMPTEELEHQMLGLAGNIAAAMCTFLVLLGEFDVRDAYRSWEARSTAQWLNWRCGVGMSAAREQVRVARALRGLPLIRDEFGAGRLSYSKVRAMTRIAHVNNEEYLIYLAHWATAAQLESVVSRLRRSFPQIDDPDLCADLDPAELDALLAERERRAHQRRSVELSQNEDGDLVVVITIPSGPEADSFEAVLDEFTELQPARRDDGEWEPLGRRRADAFLDIVSSARSESSSAAGGAEVVVNLQLTPVEAPEVGGSLGFEVIAGRPDGVDAALAAGFTASPVTTLNGTALSTEMLGRLIDDATLRRVVELVADQAGDDAASGGVHREDLGRTRRFPNRALRRRLEERDRGACRFPGCGARHRLHAHHIVFWEHGGSTDLSNLILLCHKHHRAVHDRGWTLTGTGDDPVFTRPDCQTVPAGSPSMSGSSSELLAMHREQGLHIEPDGAGSWWLGEQIDWAMIDVGFTHVAAQPPSPN